MKNTSKNGLFSYSSKLSTILKNCDSILVSTPTVIMSQDPVVTNSNYINSYRFMTPAC